MQLTFLKKKQKLTLRKRIDYIRGKEFVEMGEG